MIAADLRKDGPPRNKRERILGRLCVTDVAGLKGHSVRGSLTGLHSPTRSGRLDLGRFSLITADLDAPSLPH